MTKWIRLLSVAVWSLVIYGFSSQPLDRQNLRPWLERILSEERLARYFGWVDFSYGGHRISIGVLEGPAFAEFFIRKAAHVTEYAILGVLLFLLLASLLRQRRLAAPFSAVLCLIYAASDEYHQSFILDRTPLVQDVLLDTFGACLGIAGVALLLRLASIFVRSARRRKESYG